MEPQKTLNSQNNLVEEKKKKKAVGETVQQHAKNETGSLSYSIHKHKLKMD